MQKSFESPVPSSKRRFDAMDISPGSASNQAFDSPMPNSKRRFDPMDISPGSGVTPNQQLGGSLIAATPQHVGPPTPPDACYFDEDSPGLWRHGPHGFYDGDGNLRREMFGLPPTTPPRSPRGPGRYRSKSLPTRHPHDAPGFEGQAPCTPEAPTSPAWPPTPNPFDPIAATPEGATSPAWPPTPDPFNPMAATPEGATEGPLHVQVHIENQGDRGPYTPDILCRKKKDEEIEPPAPSGTLAAEEDPILYFKPEMPNDHPHNLLAEAQSYAIGLRRRFAKERIALSTVEFYEQRYQAFKEIHGPQVSGSLEMTVKSDTAPTSATKSVLGSDSSSSPASFYSCLSPCDLNARLQAVSESESPKLPWLKRLKRSLSNSRWVQKKVRRS